MNFCCGRAGCELHCLRHLLCTLLPALLQHARLLYRCLPHSPTRLHWHPAPAGTAAAATGATGKDTEAAEEEDDEMEEEPASQVSAAAAKAVVPDR